MNPKIQFAFIISFLAFSGPASAQQANQRISLKAALDTALKANYQFEIYNTEEQKAGFDVKSSSQLAHTGFFIENEDYRPSDKGVFKIGISQDFQWPGLYAARKEYYNQQLKSVQLNRANLSNTIKRDVRQVYYELWYIQEKGDLFMQLDSIFTEAYQAAKLKYETGDVAALEMITAEVKLNEIKTFRKQNNHDIFSLQQQLMVLLNKEERFLALNIPLEKIQLIATPLTNVHPTIAVQEQKVKVAESEVKVQKNTNMPEFSVRAFSQRLYGVEDPLSGFSLTVGIPLFGAKAATNRVRSAEAQETAEKQLLTYQLSTLKSEQQQAYAEMEKQLEMVLFYEDTGLEQAKEIIKIASLSYSSGEIDFPEFSEFLTHAVALRESYLTALNEYNQAQIKYFYFINQ